MDTKIRIEPTIWKTPGDRYQVRYRELSGRQRARSFERLVDARNFRNRTRLLQPRRGHLDTAASRLTFEAWAEAYLEQKVSLRQRTKDRYEAELRAHLLPRFGDRPLFAIARSDVQAFIVSLVDRGFAPNTIKGIYHLLATIMSLAEEDGIIQATPCRRISLPPVVIDERRFLTAAEVERLAGTIDPRYRALIYIASYLGLRWHEIAGLRRRHLELDHGHPALLRVISTIERSGGAVGSWTSARPRRRGGRFPCPSSCATSSSPTWRAIPTRSGCFPPPREAFLRYDNFRTRAWAPAVDKVELGPLTFHCLRHTAAAFMIDDGADPLQLKRRMGHEDIRPSLDTYGHLFAQRENALVDALDRRRRKALASRGSGDFLVTQTRRSAASIDPRSGDFLVTGSRRPTPLIDRESASEQRL